MRIKIISLLLALVMVCSFVLVSCGEGDIPSVNNSEDEKKPNDGNTEDSGDGEKKEYRSFSVTLGSFTVKSEGNVDISVESASFIFEKQEDGSFIGEGEGTVVEGSGDIALSRPCKLAAFGGKAYFYVESSNEGECDSVTVCELDALLGAISNSLGFDVSAVIDRANTPDALSAWLADDLVPALGSLNSSVLFGRIEEYKKAVWDLLIKEGEDGKYSVDLNLISEWNKTFSEKTAKEAYELIFGEDTFVDFKTAVAGMLTVSVNDLLQNIEKNGADREKLLSALDKLAAILSGKEGETLEGLLGIEGDIGEMLSDPETAAYNFSDLLKTVTGIQSDSDLSNMLADFYAALASKAIYEYLNSLTPEGEVGSSLGLLVGGFSDGAEISFILDKDGAIESLSVTGDFSGEENALGLILKEISLVYSGGGLEFDVSSVYPDTWQSTGKISCILSENSVSEGEIYRDITEKLSGLPDEESLLEKARAYLAERFGENVEFINGDDGIPKYALVISEDSLGEVDFGKDITSSTGEGRCIYTRRETLIDLSGFISLQYDFSEEIVITGEAVIEDSICLYSIAAVRNPNGSITCNKSDACEQNRVSVNVPDNAYSQLVFFYSPEFKTLSAIMQ